VNLDCLTILKCKLVYIQEFRGHVRSFWRCLVDPHNLESNDAWNLLETRGLSSPKMHRCSGYGAKLISPPLHDIGMPTGGTHTCAHSYEKILFSKCTTNSKTSTTFAHQMQMGFCFHIGLPRDELFEMSLIFNILKFIWWTASINSSVVCTSSP
jgi:hypothetical protein